MFDFQQKRQIKKVIYSRAMLIGLFVLMIILGRATYDIYGREQMSKTNYDAVKKEYDDLQGRQAMLDSEITRLNTQEGVENEIRGRFTVAKPGEVVVTVVDKQASSTGQNTGPSLWERFTSMF